jgi:hypothetical protein
LSESTTGGRTPPRRFMIALAAIPLVAIVLADGVLWVRQSNDTAAPRPVASQPVPQTTATTNAETQAEDRRTAEIRALLARRGQAVLDHDRKAWASTVDSRQRSFYREQLRVFDNLREVPFASWDYTFDADVERAPTDRTRRYAEPTWTPERFALHYRLEDFDRNPTNLAQYPTFVQRDGEWLLASLSDFRGDGVRSSVDLWDFGPVTVLRRGDVLVLGHPDTTEVMRVVADEVLAGIPRVTAVWGRDWARRAVVLVPSSQRELGLVVDDYGNLDQIAAVATAEVQLDSNRPNPVGDRIGINTANWPELSPLGRRIVVTHELAHVASRAATSGSIPTWLAEGFADYLGYLGTGVPTAFVAQDLAADVRAGHAPRTLPRESLFDGSSAKLSQAYEGAWMACTLLVQRYGEKALVRFYRAVGRVDGSSQSAVATVLRRMFHVTLRKFTADWRVFVRTQLG